MPNDKTITTDFEGRAFRLEMENKRLTKWLEHIYQMKDRPSVDLREAAHFALEGDVI